jgi:hypothetical protein
MNGSAAKAPISYNKQSEPAPIPAPAPQPASLPKSAVDHASLQAGVGNAAVAAAASSGSPSTPSRLLQMQSTLGNAAVTGSFNQPQTDPTPAAIQSKAPALIVEDTVETLEPGQMKKSDFLAELRTAVCKTAAEVLAGTPWSEKGCPYIEYWFGYYETQDAQHVERAARKYAPETTGAATARDYIRIISERIRNPIDVWAKTGRITGVPEGPPVPITPAAGPPTSGTLPGSTAAPSVAPIMPKARDEGAREACDPQAIQAQLGVGRPLEGHVQSRMGAAFGQDFSHVRTHTDVKAGQLTSELNARAFTVGEHVAFGPGEYQPGTLVGDAIIAHELAHVVQQGSGEVRQKGEGAYGALEDDADEAAVGAVVSLWGGAKRGSARVAKNAMPQLKSGLRLHRCSSKRSITISDPFVLGLQAKLQAKPPDKVGFFNDIRALAGSKAGNAALRDGIEKFFDDGLITEGEKFRAIALQELGEERTWHAVIKNFAEGADRGIFRVPNMPPAGADTLREYCVRTAGETAAPAGNKLEDYRTRFSAKWDVLPYAALPADFDPTLDSKGPRNTRARRIFEDLYADTKVKSSYDRDNPAGFRDLCDTLVGPEGLNLIASPRIQELRSLLGGAMLTFTGTADPAYTAFIGTVRPKAEALDANDRPEIEHSHAWRLLVDAKVAGSSTPVTPALREDLWLVVTTSHPAKPGVPPPPAVPTPAAPPPTISAAQATFLSGIVIVPPSPPQNASTDRHPLAFDVHSAVPNPALSVWRKVVVEPAAQVVTGQNNESKWLNATSAVPHTAEVNPESGVAPSTTFTAKLTMPPVPIATFPEKTATVAVTDKRIDWFKAQIKAGVLVTVENVKTPLASGAAVPYFGGQLPLRIAPTLGAGKNPGLTVTMEGEITKGGAPFKAMARQSFPSAATSAPLFDTILEEPTPPPAVAENMEVTIRFFSGPGAGVLFYTLIFPFDISPALPVAVGGDAALLASDDVLLNQPIGTPGTFLFDMSSTAAAGSAQALVAQAAATGAIKVKSCIVRSDSAMWLKAKGKDPSKQVAYALGQLDDAHTMAERPGAIGWQVPTIPDTVFLNLTPNTHNPGTKRGHAEMTGLLTHEGIHAADRAPGGHWGDYLREFRAYWVMGVGSGLSTAPDPSMSNLGPKSPRARAIFNHLYGNPTYPFVKTDYDPNVAGFREKVDNYLYPDAINLALSITLSALRKEIESYTGTGYAIKKALVTAKFAACTPDDKEQIKRNREWRDLVETKFTGTVSISWRKTEPEKDQIKTLLGIPL